MPSLILSSRPADPRRRALLSLAVGDGTVEVAAAPLPGLGGADSLIVDGSPSALDPQEWTEIETFAQRGGRVLVFADDESAPGQLPPSAVETLGADVGPAHRDGEYFARIRDDDLGARLDPELPFVGPFVELTSRGGAVAATVSVGLSDRVLVTTARRGAGRITVCGARPESVAATPLRQLLARALAAPSDGPGAPPLGVGIVGYGPFGGMGYSHALAITSTPGLDLVAVADPTDERRKAAEADFAGVTAYATADELAADPAVDIAIVATPPTLHFQLARALLRAGKHVACEKPLCLTAAEADELIATAASADRVLTVHQNRRWDADFRAVRRAVDAGLLGELFNVETFVGGFEHPCRAWHSDTGVSGGAVYDWGSHHVDWILQLLGGPPSRVTTFGHKRVWHDVTNLDQLRLHLSWDDGREAEFFQSDVAAVRRPKFFVQGTAGTLVGHYRPLAFDRIEPGRGHVTEHPHHAEAPAELTLARYESGYGLTETRLPPAPEERFAFHRNLADHLHLGEPLAVTAASVRSVVAVLEASQRSAERGGLVVELDG